MKGYLFILVILVAACNSKITVTEEEIGSDIFYVEGSYKPFSGKCIVLYHADDQVKEQFTFKKGRLHGETLAWHRNGQPRWKGSYSKGQISGKWEFYDEKGKKNIEAHYKHDNLHGSYTALYHNGMIKEKGDYVRNKRTGRWEYFNEKGQLISRDK